MAYDFIGNIEAIRKKAGIQARSPMWAVTGFSLANSIGTLFYYVNAAGQLVNQLGAALATALSPQTSYTASGAIAIVPGTALISVAGVGAMTLAAPTTAQNGTRIFITSTTNNAHTVTATSLINDGATGVPHTTATFAAFAGAGIELEAQAGLWQVVANNHVTIS